MDERETKQGLPTASRRNLLLGLLTGAGVATAVASSARAQEKAAAAPAKGAVLFRRTAETERYYKTLQNN